jgi:hypothetical protein
MYIETSRVFKRVKRFFHFVVWRQPCKKHNLRKVADGFKNIEVNFLSAADGIPVKEEKMADIPLFSHCRSW